MALSDKLNDVVGAWHGNNSDVDSSPNGNDMIRTGVTFDATNKKLGSHSFFFDKIDDDMRTTSVPLTSGDPFTIAIWIRRTALNSVQVILSSSSVFKFLEVLFISNNTIRVQLGNDSTITTVTSTLTIADNNFHMLIIRFDGTNQVTFNVDANQDVKTSSNSYVLDPASEFTFGSRGGFGRFGGNMDEIIIWDAELTDAEVTEFYNNGNGIEYPFITAVTQIITPEPAVMAFSEVVGGVFRNISRVKGATKSVQKDIKGRTIIRNTKSKSIQTDNKGKSIQ